MTQTRHEATSSAVVRTPSGSVRGRVRGPVGSWLGIPFAAPPVGARRFLPPGRPEPWSGVREATEFGPISVQDADPLPVRVPGTEHNYYHPGAGVSEDCLTLNVWAPTEPGPHPVLVWIHGGGFLCGSGTGAWTDGTTFAERHGVVVVSLNYRLGMLGWTDVSEFVPGGSNLGLRDQIAALEWVRDSIAGFGGDPTRVTIAGESAGAISVLALLSSRRAAGLFHRAIVESGLPGAVADRQMARMLTGGVLEALRLDRLAARRPDAVMAALQQTSLLRIQAAQRAFPGGLAVVADGDVLEDDHHVAAMEAARRGVELLIGTNGQENKLFSVTGWGQPLRGPDDLDDRLRALLPGDRDGTVRAEAASRYLDREGGDAQDAWDAAATHHDWTAPTHRFAREYAVAGGPVFVYEFGWRSDALDGRVGASHLLEVPFVFGNLDRPGTGEMLGSGAGSEQARALSAELNERWARFVADGTPGDGWPAFDAATRRVLLADRGGGHVSDELRPHVDFWLDHADVSAPYPAGFGVV